jgi:atypical dual specificity phosphatase
LKIKSARQVVQKSRELLIEFDLVFRDFPFLTSMHPRLAQAIFLPTYAWNLLLGRVLKLRHWWDEVEPGVFLGARPLRADVKSLYEVGVRGVVNMCDEYRGPVDLYDKLGIEQCWLRTIDFQPPTLDQVRQGVDFIRRFLDEDKKVYVHCKAGRGRSATVVLCWLMQEQGMTAAQAQAFLRSKRPHVNAALDQRVVVKEFERSLALHPKESV